MEIDELKDTFEFLGDWDSRYSYITELGEKLGGLESNEKIEDNRVKACMSNVWIVGGPAANDPSLVDYRADAEGPIIKGLVRMLLMIYSGRSAQEILDFDADELFDQLGLEEHLSPNRHVGMYAMVDRIKLIARSCMT